MKTTNLIKQMVTHLVEKFPQIQCRYEYESAIKAHYIEVLPKEIFWNDGGFVNERLALFKDFISEHPFETLTFFTEGGLHEIEQPNPHVYRGHLFGKTNSITELANDLVEMSIDCNFADNIGGLFNNHKGEFPKKLHQAVKEHDAISCTDSNCTYHFKSGRALQNLNIDKLVGNSDVVVNVRENKIMLSA